MEFLSQTMHTYLRPEIHLCAIITCIIMYTGIKIHIHYVISLKMRMGGTVTTSINREVHNNIMNE